MRRIEAEAINGYFERVCKKAEEHMMKTGRLEGAHFAAMKTVRAEVEEELKRDAVKYALAEIETEKTAKMEQRKREREIAAKEKAIEELRAAFQREMKEERESIIQENLKIQGLKDEILAREILLEGQRKRSFENQLTQPGDVIQINPEYNSDYSLRGVLGVVTEVKPDGAPVFYVQERGPDRSTMGPVSWGLVSAKQIVKVGVANWRYNPALASQATMFRKMANASVPQGF